VARTSEKGCRFTEKRNSGKEFATNREDAEERGVLVSVDALRVVECEFVPERESVRSYFRELRDRN
jgi:hypothetical protein